MITYITLVFPVLNSTNLHLRPLANNCPSSTVYQNNQLPIYLVWTIQHVYKGNWKQWKWKPEIKTENGNSQNLIQMNARVKPLINDHLL